MKTITCQFCNTVNRVADTLPEGARPICGSCKRHLFNYSSTPKAEVVTTQNAEVVMPASKKTGFLQPRFILLALCVVVWLYEGFQMSSINEQAAPYISQLQEMDSGGHFAGIFLESFIRGSMGDIFGTANEESDKFSSLKAQLAPLAMEYQSAENWSGWAFWIGFFTLCWIGIKYWKGRQTTSP